MNKTHDQLKRELMRKLEGAAERVLDWEEKHATFTLTELEEFVLGLRLGIGEDVAEMMLGQMGSKEIVEGVRCEHCGGEMIYKGQEERHAETRIGGIEVTRGRYWCPQCQRGVFPPG
jgi:DNA-directed RNA polymerase subunit RPC12/RpoP